MRVTRPERGLAMKDDNTTKEFWELFDGSARLFICGPGPDAWFPVTAPCYRSLRHGSREEREIASRAVAMLSLRFHDSHYATAADIRATLERCGWTPDPHTKYPES